MLFIRIIFIKCLLNNIIILDYSELQATKMVGMSENNREEYKVIYGEFSVLKIILFINK